jgi:hypothetical protein
MSQNAAMPVCMKTKNHLREARRHKNVILMVVKGDKVPTNGE